MQEPLEDRLAVAQRRAAQGTVHQSLVGSVRILLLALLAVPLLLVVLSILFLGAGAITSDAYILLLLFAGVTVLGLMRLSAGHLGQAVGLVIVGVLVGLARETVLNGVIGFSAFLIAYSIPIALAALIVGRRALIATAAASVGTVVLVNQLRRAGVPWIASDVDVPMPGTIVIAFVLITIFLTLVLERFGVVLRSQHEAGLRREAELAELVNELESQIEVRRQAEIEREEAEREQARLFDLERVARQSAESSSARLSFLAEASHLLSSTLDLEETLKRLSDLVVPRWADWCATDLVEEDGRVWPLVVAHRDPRRGEWALEVRRKYAMQEGPLSAKTAISTGRTQYVREISEDDLAAAAQSGEHLAALREAGFKSAVIVPFVVRGTAIGALTLVSGEEERHFSEDDVVFFEELANRAAVAVDNSRLFQEAQQLNLELQGRVERRSQELRSALAELEAFAYNLAHDLRTPLRGIDGFSQALLEDYRDRLEPEAIERLGRIRRAASKMGELFEALLTLSRVSRTDLKIEEVDLSEMARELIGELRKRDPDRQVEVLIEPGMSVRGDPDLLQLAVAALLDNSWKFSRTRKPARIEFATQIQDGERVYFVHDNGVGMDMTYYNKLFFAFQRLHGEQFEGTGIGLAVAQRVVMRHGGRIWAESGVDEGATFYFTLGT